MRQLALHSSVALVLVGFWAVVFLVALRHVWDHVSLENEVSSLSAQQTTLPAPTATTTPSGLLPLPLNLMRRSVPLSAVYDNIPTNFEQKNNAKCSCRNPDAKFKCCERRLGRSHKWGCLMSEHLFDDYKPQVRKFTEPNQFAHHRLVVPAVDFREVLVLRSIYDSVVSGYLYHVDGRECWKSGTGGPLQYGPGWRALQGWYDHLSYNLDPPRNKRSLCQYMADESEFVGMRAYVGTYTTLSVFDCIQLLLFFGSLTSSLTSLIAAVLCCYRLGISLLLRWHPVALGTGAAIPAVGRENENRVLRGFQVERERCRSDQQHSRILVQRNFQLPKVGRATAGEKRRRRTRHLPRYCLAAEAGNGDPRIGSKVLQRRYFLVKLDPAVLNELECCCCVRVPIIY